MLQTQTSTQVDIVQMVTVFHLEDVIDRTVKDKLLTDIVKFCVPKQYITRFTVYGMRGREAHARMDVTIDYTRKESPFTVAMDGVDMGSPAASECGARADWTTAGIKVCEIWREATRWFMRLCKEANLEMHWTVRFRDKQDEMCKKFGLVTAVIDDKTADAPGHTIPNSILSGLAMHPRFAPGSFPNGK